MPLTSLRFDSDKHVDKDKVRRYETMFMRQNGCNRTLTCNALPVLIDSTSFDSLEALEGPAASAFPTMAQCVDLVLWKGAVVQCLYGVHCIQAALRTLPLLERWWCVALYDSSKLVKNRLGGWLTRKDIPQSARAQLLLQKKKTTRPPGGRDLLYVLNETDNSALATYYDYLTHDQLKLCKRLRFYDNGKLSNEIKQTLGFNGLQHTIKTVGSFKPILSMHCDEVIALSPCSAPPMLMSLSGVVRLSWCNPENLDLYPWE